MKQVTMTGNVCCVTYLLLPCHTCQLGTVEVFISSLAEEEYTYLEDGEEATVSY